MHEQDAPLYYEGQYSTKHGHAAFIALIIVLVLMVVIGAFQADQPCGDRWDPGYEDCIELQHREDRGFDYPLM